MTIKTTEIISTIYLEHLFHLALKSLEFEVIPPAASGSDLIQAEIIRNLEMSDLVLCDMSTLNPNVFIEPWTLPDDVLKLKEHITNSVERSQDQNMLWKYFGLTAVAAPPTEESGTDAKIDRLTIQVEEMNRRLEISCQQRRRQIPTVTRLTGPPNAGGSATEFLADHSALLKGRGYSIPSITGSGNAVVTLNEEYISEYVKHYMIEFAEMHGIAAPMMRPLTGG